MQRVTVLLSCAVLGLLVLSLRPEHSGAVGASGHPVPGDQSRVSAAAHKAKTRRLVIVLDPGHGGSDTGAIHQLANGTVDVMEKTVTLELALRVAGTLRRDGFSVYLTRTSDRAVNIPPRDYNHDGQVDEVDELEARVAFANRHHANLFVSLHVNGSDSADSRGLTVYYCPAHRFASNNVRLARDLDSTILSSLRSVGYSPRNWGVLSDVSDMVPQRYADYPWFFQIGPSAAKHGIIGNKAVAALGETLYATNNYEAALLNRPRVLDAIAGGYVIGIERYLRSTSRR